MFYEAAIAVGPGNFLAANDLAVLLAAARKAGHDLEDRRALLEAAARQG